MHHKGKEKNLVLKVSDHLLFCFCSFSVMKEVSLCWGWVLAVHTVSPQPLLPLPSSRAEALGFKGLQKGAAGLLHSDVHPALQKLPQNSDI